MSAFLVDPEHIRQLVNFRWNGCQHYRRHVQLTDGNGSNIYRMQHHADGITLGRANLASIAARYPDDEKQYRHRDHQRENDFLFECGRPTTFDRNLTLGDIASMLACFTYQSCEYKEWETSHAKKWCDDLRDEICRCIREVARPTKLANGASEPYWDYSEKRRDERRFAAAAFQQEYKETALALQGGAR
jgi:hypothetical protein